VALANAPPKAVADQSQVVKTRNRNHGRVLTWFASRWPTTSPSELKSLTRNSVAQAAGRPCYEAEDSACRGQKLSAKAKGSEQPAWDRKVLSRKEQRGTCRRPAHTSCGAGSTLGGIPKDRVSARKGDQRGKARGGSGEAFAGSIRRAKQSRVRSAGLLEAARSSVGTAGNARTPNRRP
jgi:hypothetical protein